jgi:predicted Zn-dependent protease
MRSVPDHISELRTRMQEIVAQLEQKFPYAELLFSENEGISIGLTENETRVNENPSRRGVVISVFNGSYKVETSLTDVSAESLHAAARNLINTVPIKESDTELDPGDYREADYYSSVEENPHEMSFEDKLTHLSGIRDESSSLSSSIAASMVRYGERTTRKVYVNRHKNLFQELLQTLCIPIIIVTDGKSTRLARSGNAKQAGFEVARIPTKKLEQMMLDGKRMLGASPVPPGEYDLVCGPGLSGVIAHEAFGHGVEADMFVKNRAKATEFMGKSVASPLVNLYDSPDRMGESGSYFFDDEGMESSSTCIIENGILKRALTDHLSAVLLDLPRTANGRRESFGNKVYARMSNTFFGGGISDVDDMIASIDSGFYLPRGSNGMEDPKNWGIQAESPYALEIKQGSLTGNVFAPAVITGFVPDLLNSITMVSKQIELEGTGICQKGHKEQVAVAIGGPHLKLKARVG